MDLRDEQIKDLPNELVLLSKQELLFSEIKDLNPSTLFSDLRHNMSKVNNFKKFMEIYNKKNFAGKWWDNDQLEDAMVDSISVQGDVLKTTSKLIVLNTYFSKVLNDQQGILKEQQDQIHGQTTKNLEFTENIANLQRLHKEEQDKLALSVKSALSAMGLNQDQILLLLDLEEKFQNAVKIFENTKDEIQNLLENTVHDLREEVDKNISNFKQYVDFEIESVHTKLINNEKQSEEEFKKQAIVSNEIDHKIIQLQEYTLHFSVEVEEIYQTIEDKDLSLKNKVEEAISVFEQKYFIEVNNLNKKLRYSMYATIILFLGLSVTLIKVFFS